MISWIVTIPDHHKTQEMCNDIVHNKLFMILFVPDHFWTQEMCNEIMCTMPDTFHRIPDYFKKQEMCGKAVKYDSSSLQFVPDWFVTREWMWMWYDDYYNYDGDHLNDDNDEDKFFEWYDEYKKPRAQKATIKEEYCLAPIKLLGLVYVRR